MVAPMLLAPPATFQAPTLLTTLSRKKLLAHKLLKDALYITKDLTEYSIFFGYFEAIALDGTRG
jgi:hypothetical protein